MRVNRNVSARETRTHTFDGFKGVDFTTSPSKVASFRATHAQNLIYEDGTVRKRRGWKSLINLPARINGIYTFKIENEDIILCYAGTTFYKLRQDNERLVIEATYSLPNLTDTRPQLYVNNNRAYIVGCGDYLVYGKWDGDFELRSAYGLEDNYIPTTTINIDPDGTEGDITDFYEPVNRLTPWRKNTLVGSAEPSTWTLDTGSIDEGSDVTVEIETYISSASGGYLQTTVLRNNGEDKTQLLQIDWKLGSIDFEQGKISLNTLAGDTSPPIEGVSNITVTFSKTEENSYSLVKNATTSVLFGGGGSTNRLFLGGTSNSHVWSEIYDFSYFPDTNFEQLGAASSKIVGYVRVSDGTLAAFKEQNGSDSTIYYITGVDEEYAGLLGEKNFRTAFYRLAGNAVDTLLSPFATANLNGDNLILTRNGVKGLQLYENVAVAGYNLQERSRNINSKLLKSENLHDAAAFVYKDRYFLSVDGVVYIADSRFTFQNEEDINSSYNYEWWFWTNVDARVWHEMENELYFGTSKGEICKFYEGYSDISFVETEDGDLSLQTADNGMAYTWAIANSLSEGDTITVENEDFYSLHLDNTELSVGGGKIIFAVDTDSEEYIYKMLGKVIDGMKVYASPAVGGLELNKEYTIGDVSLDNLTFVLYDGETPVNVAGSGFNLYRKLTGLPLIVENLNKDFFQLKEFIDGDVLTLAAYGNTPSHLVATISFIRNVIAEWYTPTLDLGTNMYAKTLRTVTVAAETLSKSNIVIGYVTYKSDLDFASSDRKGFDFTDIDFRRFSFGGNFANSLTVRVKERNFNYIGLRYYSNNQNACAVNSITIRYTINAFNKGVR